MSRIPRNDENPTYRRSTIRRRSSEEPGADAPGADAPGTQAPGANAPGTQAAGTAALPAVPKAAAPKAAAPKADAQKAAVPSPAASPAPTTPNASASPRPGVSARTPAPPPRPAAPPPRPSLDGDALLAELDNLAPGALAALLSAGSPADLEIGDEVTGSVVRITSDTVFVDIGAKSEAWLARAELGAEEVEPGSVLTARVLSVGGQGLRLTRQLSGAAGQDALEAAMEAGIPVQGRVDSRNTGGFVVMLGSIRAFCPISHIDRHPDVDLDAYLGRMMSFKVLEVRGRDVVVSHKAIAQEEIEAHAAALWTTLRPGAELDGVITGVKPYGVFVDVDGITGLVHRSELGWSEAGTEEDGAGAHISGQRVRVRVVEVDAAAGRLSLSMKDEAMGPWSRVGTEAGADIQVGEVYEGKVVRLADFGAFIELLPGLQGLAHISTLSDRRIGHPAEVLKVGELVRVRVLSADKARERLELGLRQATEQEWEPAEGGRRRGGAAHKDAGTLGTFADLLGGLKLKKG